MFSVGFVQSFLQTFCKNNFAKTFVVMYAITFFAFANVNQVVLLHIFKIYVVCVTVCGGSAGTLLEQTLHCCKVGFAGSYWLS